jgi:hypothetical protein
LQIQVELARSAIRLEDPPCAVDDHDWIRQGLEQRTMYRGFLSSVTVVLHGVNDASVFALPPSAELASWRQMSWRRSLGVSGVFHVGRRPMTLPASRL